MKLQSGKKKANGWLDGFAVMIIICLFIGFLFNRVASNIGFIAAGVYALLRLKSTRELWKDKWLWSFIAMAVIPIFSDIITEGIYFISGREVKKALMVLFPFFIFGIKPDRKKIRIINYIVIITMLVSTAYSMTLYFMNISEILASYRVSKVMEVLAYQDHIRISWVTVLSILLAFYELKQNPNQGAKIFLFVYVAIQVAFLHVLGAKTGLLTLYMSAIVASIYRLPAGQKWLVIPVIAMLGLGLLVAVKFVPSLNERVNFIRYDMSHYLKGEYREGLSDAVRFYSLKAGKDIIQESPIFGVGFSKLREETSLWYDTNLPKMEVESRFLPSSEYIIYWASAGIFGLGVILWHVIMPFFIGYLRRNVWFMTYFIPVIFLFTFETPLEGQLPIFVYCFFTVWFWYLAWKSSKSDDKKVVIY